MSPSEPRLMRIADVAAALGGVSERQVHRLIRAKQLRAVRTGRGSRPHYMVRPADLEAYIDSLPSNVERSAS